ncbi:MAG: threonine synthase [Bacteroidales bacterium]
MLYCNIKDRRITAGFREAVMLGISPDMGLFMPEQIPSMDADFFRRLPGMSLPEIALEVGTHYTGDDIPLPELKRICTEAFDFPVIFKRIDDRKHVLELFHGPTAAFKDFGARFMSGCFRYFASHDDRKTVVLVATSGDTGGAIASSFLGVGGVDVIILYPSGKVSLLQENQLTTLGQNITALEVRGTFDDCQAMVKQALTVLDTRGRIRLTSANSINIARLIPQTFYYYYAAARNGRNTVVSVPSGNCGNITAAAIAWRSGLSIGHLIAATNINRVVPDYLSTGVYSTAVTIQTIANAMDVGNPNNLDRLRHVFDGEFRKLAASVSGYWFDDEMIKRHISEVYSGTGYILDPHGAVASLGLDRYLGEHPGAQGIFVETAHPAKFSDIVEPLIGRIPEMPDTLKSCLTGEKKSVVMEPQYSYLSEYLAGRYSLT